ncbi:MAG: hypothetical protein E7135_00410 [Rikenellaceae bacterium]|nr:hypothetical protein [Rikenellaceae bacterium]
MNNSILEKDERMISQWWLAAIVGIVAIGIGFIVLVNPIESYLTAAVWLGVAIFVSGVMGLILSIASKNIAVRRGWAIAASIIDILLGLMLMFNILFTVAILPLIFGIWLLYRGAISLMQALDLRGLGVDDTGWMIFGSVVMIVISFVVLWLPETLGAEAVILFMAMAFMIYGVSMIAYAFRLAALHRRAKELM